MVSFFTLQPNEWVRLVQRSIVSARCLFAFHRRLITLAQNIRSDKSCWNNRNPCTLQEPYHVTVMYSFDGQKNPSGRMHATPGSAVVADL